MSYGRLKIHDSFFTIHASIRGILRLIRITYVVHGRFPVEKAYGKQIAEVCSAMMRLGHTVTLLCPTIRNPILQSATEYYGLPDSLDVRYLHHFDATFRWWIPGILRFAVTMFFYRSALRIFFRRYKADLFYVRAPLLVPPLAATGSPVLLELHTLPQRGRFWFLRQCSRCALLVCLTSAMRDALVSWGIDEENVLVEADGVDLSRFASMETSERARTRYRLPSRPIVGYVGSLVTHNTIEKGVGELVIALELLKDRGVDCFGFIVGGPRLWRDRYEQKALATRLTKDDILLLDRVPPTEVPSVLSACDLLVYPAPSSLHPYFQRDTSPLKLFEYLAAGRPVVCADIPPVRDVVDETTVHLCPPGDPLALADAIEKVLKGGSDLTQRVSRGREIAAEHSWEKRMTRILRVVAMTNDQ